MALGGWSLIGVAAVVAVAAFALLEFLFKSIKTFQALAFVPLLSRRMSPWVKSRDLTEDELLRADGAGDSWVERRREGLDRLASRLQDQYARSIAWGNSIR